MTTNAGSGRDPRTDPEMQAVLEVWRSLDARLEDVNWIAGGIGKDGELLYGLGHMADGRLLSAEELSLVGALLKMQEP